MFSSAGEARSGHERTHDPCRADLKEWTAEHPLPVDADRVIQPGDLAPTTGAGGHSPYSFEGRAIQAAGLFRALRAHRRRSVRTAGWLIPGALALVVASGIVASVAAILSAQ